MIENETTRVLDCYLTIDGPDTDSGVSNSTAYPGLVAHSGITTLTNYRLGNDHSGRYQAGAVDVSHSGGPALPTADPHATVRTHYEELKRSLQGHAEPPNARANTLQKIARLTRQQFQELSTDVYDELVRRNNEKDGSKTSFLPVRDDFHAKRNEARRKLSTLPYDRLKHLLSDVFYELGRRYPEFKRSQTLSAVPDTPLSDLGIPTPELAGGCPPAAVSPSLQLSARHQTTTEVHTPRQTSVSQTSPVVGEPSQSTPSAPSLETTVRISRTMTSVEIMRQLTLFGCQNITSDLLLAKCGRRPLASGGFGDVYQGQLSGGTHVAIKCVRMFGSLDDEEMHQTYVMNAVREMHTWSKLQHSHILKLLGLVEYRDQIGMVSPWMAGGSLRRYLKHTPGANRPRLSTQIADGLSYLHQSGVIHGDLKGDNVLMSDSGEPLITDFGNAVLEERTLQFTSTITKNQLSPRWTAPEIFSGGMRSFESDVFALGMTILETVTADVPYAGMNDMAVMFAIAKNESPKRPETQIRTTSKHGDMLWALLKDCWALDPGKRLKAVAVRDKIAIIGTDDLTD